MSSPILGERQADRHAPAFTRTITHAPNSALLGSTTSAPVAGGVLKPGAKLYIQMVIRTFEGGSEDVIDRLYSDEGPVSDVAKAKTFLTMSAALKKAGELLSLKTKEYQVLASTVRTAENITVRPAMRYTS